MKWSFREPKPGDMVRVMVGTIYHFGIYVSDDEVIQFGLPPARRGAQPDSEVEVLSADIDSFLAGGFLEVADFDRKERKKNRSPKEIIAYARERIGMRGYNILYNNCEHFANECVSGVKICRQAEDLRAFFRSMPVSDVYIAELPTDAPMERLSCAERQSEIDSVSNERVRREKYFVWKLLTYALDRSFGRRGDSLDFRRMKYGGWTAGDIYISLAHSGSALAVAVSRAPIGVDIELVHSPRSDSFAERIMTEGELALLMSMPENERESFIIKSWTAKEAIFKSLGKDSFVPRDYDTRNGKTKSGSITVNGEEYIWSCATATPERVRVFSGIDLK